MWLLGRFSKDIVVNFDPDTAGAAATDKSRGMLLEEEFNIRVLRLEAGLILICLSARTARKRMPRR